MTRRGRQLERRAALPKLWLAEPNGASSPLPIPRFQVALGSALAAEALLPGGGGARRGWSPGVISLAGVTRRNASTSAQSKVTCVPPAITCNSIWNGRGLLRPEEGRQSYSGAVFPPTSENGAARSGSGSIGYWANIVAPARRPPALKVLKSIAQPAGLGRPARRAGWRGADPALQGRESPP